jgi:enoyl-CoA hydratase
MNIRGLFERRSVLKAGALLGGLSALLTRAQAAHAAERDNSAGEALAEEVKMTEIPLSPAAKVTVERRGQIVLIGINRPYIHNRVDPETYAGLAKAYYQYDHDSSLRAAVLFGHGDNFSRGIDVDAFAATVTSGRPRTQGSDAIDPLAKTAPARSKPLVVVAHGDTWNMGHELLLAADIRVAAADTRFGQDETSHGRFRGVARRSASCARPDGETPCATC